MSSGGREFLKWLAVLLMTGDHVVTAFGLGYVPVVTEGGRVAFPLFALVMGYNLAQPGADALKSVRRLALWGLVASLPAYLVFGSLLPLNVLFTFSLAAVAIWAAQRCMWPLVAVCAVALPPFVDYAWPGVWLVLAAWGWFRHHGRRMHWLLGSWDWRRARLYAVLPIWVWITIGLLCLYNGNGWALLALPLMQVGEWRWPVPRTRWAFYGYYVLHLSLLAALQLGGYQLQGIGLPSCVSDSNPCSVLMSSTPPLHRALSGKGIPVVSAGTSRTIVTGSGATHG